MSALTEARAEWAALEQGRLYFCPNAALMDANYARHMLRDRVLTLAETIETAGSTEAGVEAFRQSHAIPADPNELASALELLA